MSLKAYFIYALDEFLKKRKNNLSSRLSIVLFIVIMFVSGILKNIASYEQYMVERELNYSSGEIVLFDFELGSREKTIDFFQKLRMLDEVNEVTTIYRDFISMGSVPELKEIQKGHYIKPSGYSDDYDLEVLFLQPSGCNICNLKTIEEINLSNMDLNDYKEVDLILGNAFSSIPIGTKYTNRGITYNVAGILEKGEKCISPELSNSVYLDDLEYQIICLSYEPISNYVLATSKNGEVSAMIESVKKLSDKEEVKCGYSTIEELFERDRINNGVYVSLINKIAYIFIIVSIIFLMCVQTVEVLGKKYLFGVWYANGMRTKDIVSIYVIEKIIEFLVLVVFVTVFFLIGMIFSGNNIMKSMGVHSLIIYGLPSAIILGIIFELIAFVVPVYTVSRMDPSNLLRREL